MTVRTFWIEEFVNICFANIFSESLALRFSKHHLLKCILYLMMVNLSTFSFVVYNFCMQRNFCLLNVTKILFSSGRFLIQDFTFRLMIYFELIFADRENYGLKFIMLQVIAQLFSTIY